MRNTTTRRLITLSLPVLLLTACGGGSSRPIVTPPPPPPSSINTNGSIYDGPVSGGTLFVFDASDVNAAIEAASDASDRAAALTSANPVASLARDSAGDETYTLDVPADRAGAALFFVFDSEGAEDQTFGGQPFNLEGVAIAGAAGSQLRINLTPHTTIAAHEVRNVLDPDGDGTVIDVAAITNALATALANVQSAFGQSALGVDLFPGGEDPHSTADGALLDAASTELGRAVRTAAGFSGLSFDEVLFLLAADAADGALDGAAPVEFALSPEQIAEVLALSDIHDLGRARVTDIESATCTAATNSLRRSCEFEVLDEFFVGAAICSHNGTEAEADTCLESFAEGRDEALVECNDVYDARLDVCAATNDAVHEPPFGPAFAANFVDPRTIGGATAPNPWFPMVQGAVWTYEGTFIEEGEEITEVVEITVTDRTKLVDGIRCLVVRDVVTIDGELIEDTDDWFAQDTDGNIWYCGEEVKDYETFDGDSPAIPELVAIDGSFKAGRDGDEAGILLPSALVAGDIFRQEVSFTNAEDAIEILATNASETVPAAICDGTCLQTRDFSALDPGVNEHKFYAPGVGKILEVDIESGNRVELISFTLP